jgi:hypothetical protein
MYFIRRLIEGCFIPIIFLSLLLLSLALIVQMTFLDAGFMIRTLNSVDITPFIESAIEQTFDIRIPKEVRKDFAEKIKALIKDKLEQVIVPIYDYLLGKSESLHAVVPLDTLKKDFKPVLLDYLLKSQPEEYKEKIKKEYETFWNEISSGIPDTIDVNRIIEQNKAAGVIADARRVIAMSGRAILILIIISIFCMIAIILARQHPLIVLLIFGIEFLLLGLIFFISSTASASIDKFKFITTQIPDFFKAVLFDVLQAVSIKVRILGIIYAAGGICCIVLPRLLLKKRRKQDNTTGAYL